MMKALRRFSVWVMSDLGDHEQVDWVAYLDRSEDDMRFANNTHYH